MKGSYRLFSPVLLFWMMATIQYKLTDGTVIWTQPVDFTPAAPEDVGRSTRQILKGSTDVSLIWEYSLTGETPRQVEFYLDSGKIGDFLPSPIIRNTDNFRQRFNITTNAQVDQVALIIFNVTDAEEGLYKCDVTTDDGNVWRNHVDVQVVDAPNITHISDNQTVSEDDVVTLNCTADDDGNPTPDITWKRVSDDSPVSFPLTISGKEDEGFYRCTANNSVATVDGRDVFITVENYHPFNTQVMTSLQNNITMVNETFNVTCSAEANPPAEYVFNKNDELAANITHPGVHETSVTQRVNQVRFSCVPFNVYGDGPRKEITIDVHYAPSILHISDNQTVSEDDVVTLNCTADGNPTPDITWKRVSDDSPVSFNFTITGKQDEGFYRCTANNSVGTPASTDVYIKVDDFHPFRTQLNTSSNNNTVNITETFNITCSAEANPSAKYRFYREQQLVCNDTSGPGVYTTRASDRVPQVTYRCIPYNSFGDGAEKNITVTVHYPSYMIDPPNETQRVETNSTINFPCLANGNPDPSITWINATGGAAVGSDGILSFRAKESDDGFTFICKADNGIGPAASFNILLIVGKNSTTFEIRYPEETFVLAYRNPDSPDYQTFATRIKDGLRMIPEISNEVVGLDVLELREGSVIAVVLLKFKHIVHIGSVISAIRDAAGRGNIGDLEVDPTSIRLVQGPDTTSTSTTTPASTTKTTPKASDFPWWILGVAVGGLILLAILIAIVAWCIHKKRKCRRKDTRVHSENEAQPLEEFSNGTPNGENAENAYAQVNHGYAKSGPAPTNENNQGAASASAVPPVTYAVVDKSKKNEKPPEYAVVDKSKKKKKNSASEETPLGDQYAAVDKSKKKKKKSGANEEKPPEDQYAVVLKSQKKKNPEEPEQQYAQVDRSMKKKHAKPGEVLYADLGEFHGNNSLPKVSTSPEPLPPIKKPTPYGETQYADITQFLKGDATLPPSDGTGGVTPAAQGQPTAGAQVGTGGAAATPPGEDAGGGSSHVSKL